MKNAELLEIVLENIPSYDIWAGNENRVYDATEVRAALTSALSEPGDELVEAAKKVDRDPLLLANQHDLHVALTKLEKK
jgi:hypothetical protein